MREQFKQMVNQAGKEFKEEDFQQIISLASGSMGASYLRGLDHVVIAIGFGQFILDGNIDDGLNKVVKIAIQRELMPIMINQIDEKFHEERKKRLNQMLSDLSKISVNTKP